MTGAEELVAYGCKTKRYGGSEAASAFLRSYGGSMDTVQFSAILQGSINSYSIIWAVLFFIGGLGCLISIIIFEQQKQ